VVRLLSLLESCFDGADQSDVLIDDDAHGQHVLLGLSLVEFADADLDVGEAVERAREGRRQFDRGEGVQRSGKVAASLGEPLALDDD
jgi:hypothetical protein